MCELSLVAASRGYSLLWCVGFSLGCGLLTGVASFVASTGSRVCGVKNRESKGSKQIQLFHGVLLQRKSEKWVFAMMHRKVPFLEKREEIAVAVMSQSR